MKSLVRRAGGPPGMFRARLKLVHGNPARVARTQQACIINEIIKEAEVLGETGEIDQAQAKLESCEKLKSECKYLEIVSYQENAFVSLFIIIKIVIVLLASRTECKSY